MEKVDEFCCICLTPLILLKTLGNSAKIRDFLYPDKNAKIAFLCFALTSENPICSATLVITSVTCSSAFIILSGMPGVSTEQTSPMKPQIDSDDIPDMKEI